MSQYRLTTALLARSQSKVWCQAQREWEFVTVQRGDGKDGCLCGHSPIVNLCKLRNKLNKNTAIVGNCCVKRFLNLPTNSIFDAVKRIEQDPTRSVNLQTLNHVRDEAWITEWEYDFYRQIQRKQFKKFSPKRALIKIEINHKILRRIQNNKK